MTKDTHRLVRMALRIFRNHRSNGVALVRRIIKNDGRQLLIDDT